MENQRYQKIGLSLDYVQHLTAPSRKLVENLVNGLEASNSFDLPPNREMFARNIFSKANLSVDPGFWKVFHPDFGFELWSFDLEYLLGCGKFYSLTSYSQQELLSTSWFDLFDRDEIHQRQIVSAIKKVATTNQPVMTVTPQHLVSEKRSPKKVSLLVAVKAIFPVYLMDDPDTSACIVALTEFKQLS